ncbi:MAG: hypothetical protein EOO92_13810 [Pedobacter sp.]|nr:MAG: hypothetical protein EOO92_13810 [Pedobacter sp.]
MWVYRGKTYVQQFDECKSYKPMVTAGSVFSQFFKENKDSLVKEKLLEVVKITHQDIYELTFVSPGKEDRKIIVDEYNLIKPADKWGNAPLANYNLNMQTKLSQFIPMVREEVKKYRLMITSGAERAKVGKMP